jgi:hypothetical protein
MEELRHELALAAANTIIESLPAKAFVQETKASIAFHLYHQPLAFFHQQV